MSLSPAIGTAWTRTLCEEPIASPSGEVLLFKTNQYQSGLSVSIYVCVPACLPVLSLFFLPPSSHGLSVALHLEIRPQEMSSITHWHSHRCCCCAGNRLGEISLLQQLSVLSRRHCLAASERTTLETWLSLCLPWVLGIEFNLSDLCRKFFLPSKYSSGFFYC